MLSHKDRMTQEKVKSQERTLKAIVSITLNVPGAHFTTEKLLEIVLPQTDLVFLKSSGLNRAILAQLNLLIQKGQICPAHIIGMPRGYLLNMPIPID
ncbi:hypothetical protein [Chitinophaga sp. MM2321]|uniref:hypothetical protein n=1 Tax=Chitinophaga sp. MM2321 TaxID=3137178 RepID=UPI0032D56DC9